MASDSLRAGLSGDPSRPASYTMGTVSFAKIKQPGRGVDPPSSAEVKDGVELYVFSPSGSLWPVLGRTLPLPTIGVSDKCSRNYAPSLLT